MDIFLSVVALSVSAMPEGLPLALTMALTIGSNKMSKRNVIVKKLNSVESLGSCTVIASDKTGTLTVNLANYNSSSETLTATPSWDGEVYAAATKYDVTVPGVSSPITVNATPQSVGDGLLVVPNPTVNAASISSFVVNYTLNGHNYNIEHTPAENQVMYPGYKYIYNISFTTHEIKVTATVADWDATTQHGASI